MPPYPKGAYALIAGSMRRIPPPPIQPHIQFGQAARLECKNSSRAAFFIYAKFDDFRAVCSIAAVWYRLMADYCEFQRERMRKHYEEKIL